MSNKQAEMGVREGAPFEDRGRRRMLLRVLPIFLLLAIIGGFVAVDVLLNNKSESGRLAGDQFSSEENSGTENPGPPQSTEMSPFSSGETTNVVCSSDVLQHVPSEMHGTFRNIVLKWAAMFSPTTSSARSGKSSCPYPTEHVPHLLTPRSTAAHGPTQVLPSDTIVVPPDSNGPIIAPIVGYNWREYNKWPDQYFERPIYEILDRDKDDYWNYLIDELLLSRVDVVMLHGRGCWDPDPGSEDSLRGSGDMCPRLLDRFVAAVQRAGAEDVIRVGMWDDTGAYDKARNHIEGGDARFDLSREANWKYFWDYNIKIWFDTLPPALWYRIQGKPIIAAWVLKDRFFSEQEGNASRLLSWLRRKFHERYEVEPYFVLHRTWFEADSTITTDHAEGKHGWFKADEESSFTYIAYNGALWGVGVPGFRSSNTRPGCGIPCREILRHDGEVLNRALVAGKEARLILLEGWTDMIESAGFYRSLDWQYPAQYINMVRRYADREPETLRFQAEGADSFYDTTDSNHGGSYADRALDVGPLDDNTGWYVGWTDPGEWIEYQHVELGCGTYRFTARVASPFDGQRVRLDGVNGGLESVTTPNTGGWDQYDLVHLGETRLEKGSYNLRFVFETGNVNLDWFFAKRVNRCAIQTPCISSALARTF